MFLWMHQCAWFSFSHYTRLSRLFPFPKSKIRTYNIYFALSLSQLSNECASLAFLVQQYLANSVSKISLRIWYLVFFVETNTKITFDNFLSLLLKMSYEPNVPVTQNTYKSQRNERRTWWREWVPHYCLLLLESPLSKKMFK